MISVMKDIEANEEIRNLFERLDMETEEEDAEDAMLEEGECFEVTASNIYSEGRIKLMVMDLRLAKATARQLFALAGTVEAEVYDASTGTFPLVLAKENGGGAIYSAAEMVD